jgi:hypothetical protein
MYKKYSINKSMTHSIKQSQLSQPASSQARLQLHFTLKSASLACHGGKGVKTYNNKHKGQAVLQLEVASTCSGAGVQAAVQLAQTVHK